MADTMSVLERIRGGLIVSCQPGDEEGHAEDGDPFNSPEAMSLMALAVIRGGAAGIRVNAPDFVSAIRRMSALPVVGLWKVDLPRFEVRITPTVEAALALADAGADIVAFDATERPRPGGLTVPEFIRAVKARTCALLLADVATVEEGVAAAEAGADLLASTLSGYTSYSRGRNGPDVELVRLLATGLSVPVVSEGRYTTPAEVGSSLQRGSEGGDCGDGHYPADRSDEAICAGYPSGTSPRVMPCGHGTWKTV